MKAEILQLAQGDTDFEVFEDRASTIKSTTDRTSSAGEFIADLGIEKGSQVHKNCKKFSKNMMKIIKKHRSK